MKTEYERPLVVLLVYVAAIILAIVALFVTVHGGPGALVLFGPAAVAFLTGYALELLSRILHELRRIREQAEMGTVFVAPAASPADRAQAIASGSPTPLREDFDYFLLDNLKSTGPFPLKALLNRLHMGTLQGDAPVQRAGSKNWVALETLDT